MKEPYTRYNMEKALRLDEAKLYGESLRDKSRRKRNIPRKCVKENERVVG